MIYPYNQHNMKTKKQILEWLNEQPWKNEFYEEAFFDRGLSFIYDEYFICGVFDWSATKSGAGIWKQRDIVFRQWYNSNDKPMSWEEYCKQNPIKEDDYYIDDDCEILHAWEPSMGGGRNADTDASVMPKDLCEAFVAYMKLIQLRNAWVENCDASDCTVKIVVKDNAIFKDSYMQFMNGLSFPTHQMTSEFMHTFEDLLEVAKPLL